MDIKKFHSLCINHAQREFDKHKMLPMTIFALKPDGSVVVLQRTFEDDEDKQHMYNIYAMILAAEQCEMYCLVSESWVSKRKNLNDNIDDVDLSKLPRPMDDPNRSEAVIVITTDINDSHFMNMFEIKTKDNQKYLSDDDSNDSQTQIRDNLKLFKRLPPKRTQMTNDSLKQLLNLSRPDWYSTISKESFSNVKVDA